MPPKLKICPKSPVLCSSKSWWVPYSLAMHFQWSLENSGAKKMHEMDIHNQQKANNQGIPDYFFLFCFLLVSPWKTTSGAPCTVVLLGANFLAAYVPLSTAILLLQIRYQGDKWQMGTKSRLHCVTIQLAKNLCQSTVLYKMTLVA